MEYFIYSIIKENRYMIKLFEQFNDYNQVDTWLYKMGITNYSINDDLTVDVNGDVILTRMDLDNIPVQFGNVNGTFDCGMNNLTSLKGCPIYISGALDCYNNRIESLEYFPKHIGSYVNITTNRLKSLNCKPAYIKGSFIYVNNPLPKEIKDFPDPKIIMKYQEEYGLWNSNETLNKERWDLFISDFDNGLLT